MLPLQPLIPEYEVKVQLDMPEDSIIVYKVLEKESGAVVLQIPSAEQLRGIHQTQELLQRIAARGKLQLQTRFRPGPKGRGEQQWE